jgi:hypothetical protein
MLHGAGIFTCPLARKKSPSFVGKYTSTMERMGTKIYLEIKPAHFQVPNLEIP